ncbi:class I SAM-dependent methyltransferase [Embleya sp. NPDC050154]|uniref:class I SAM-dependent methyltransferase n=1 Tax=unclassified Embleya TaxID=2699296 RepID=UPI00379E8EEF
MAHRGASITLGNQGECAMRMNTVEKIVVASPLRRAPQIWYETPLLLRLGGRLAPGAHALEIGCGTGRGIELILNRFGAARVDGIDLDHASLAKARRRWHGNSRVALVEGSATDLRGTIGAADASYDAVFDFAIVHHITDWRACLAEVGRVLRPGGRFYFSEMTARALARPTLAFLFDHPIEDRFDDRDFLAELPRHGLDVLGSKSLLGDYFFGVARRR